MPPFRVGLWVGRKTTPNQTAQSLKAVEAMRGGQRPPAGIGSPANNHRWDCLICRKQDGQGHEETPPPGGYIVKAAAEGSTARAAFALVVESQGDLTVGRIHDRNAVTTR